VEAISEDDETRCIYLFLAQFVVLAALCTSDFSDTAEQNLALAAKFLTDHPSIHIIRKEDYFPTKGLHP
jgi:hypothetical protein